MSARYVLGISAYYHDSAAALLDQGEVVAAAQEERFTRKRHDAAFPAQAVDYCLREAGITAADLAYVAFYDKPLRKFDRLLETYFAYAPRGLGSFLRAMPAWLREKLHMGRNVRRGLGPEYRADVVFPSHHESHAASAFYASPFERAAIVTCDGVGEWATTTIGLGEGGRLRLDRCVSFPHSLGLLYSAFTYFTGFKVNSGEYKLMGLAPFGEPRYTEVIRRELVDIKDDGSFRLNMRYFDYPVGLRMTGAEFARLFGGPPRDPESTITQREMDMAASIQVVLEDILLRMAAFARRETGAKALCLAGGVALNCVANGRLLREGPFDEIWIQPAAGDAGGALGAALFTWHQLLERPRTVRARDGQKGSLLGPAFDMPAIEAAIAARGARHRVFDDEAALLDEVARHREGGAVGGWFHGRMEFGPRALGARSILGDPRDPTMQSRMNVKIKLRESFRPFAPMVLRERASEIFELSEGVESPYMLLVANVRERYRRDVEASDAARADPDLRRRVQLVRSDFPAITHVDGSARLQTVDPERHGRTYRLLRAFEALTGCPLLVNTSFNVRGEPIVHSPAEALQCFLQTDMDAVVLEDALLLKSEQPSSIVRALSSSPFPLD
ncbi:MAG: carbamoyltransferase [Polyangiaceae bacterium]